MADAGMMGRIEAWFVSKLAELTYEGRLVFAKTVNQTQEVNVDHWKHQIASGQAGIESFDRYAPFAFVKWQPYSPAGREGDYDLNQKIRIAIAIGQMSKEKGVARFGSDTAIGTAALSRLVATEPVIATVMMQDLVIPCLPFDPACRQPRAPPRPASLPGPEATDAGHPGIYLLISEYTAPGQERPTGGTEETAPGPITVERADTVDFVGSFRLADPKRTNAKYRGTVNFNAGGAFVSVEYNDGQRVDGKGAWSFDRTRRIFAIDWRPGGRFEGTVSGNTHDFVISGRWSNGKQGRLRIYK